MFRRGQQFVCGSLFALFFFYAIANAYFTFQFLGSSSAQGWSVNQRSEKALVSQVRADGPATPLRVNDEVVAINNQTIDNTYDVIKIFRNFKPGTSYQIVVRRDGELKEYTLATEDFPVLVVWRSYLATLLLPAIFLITGLIVFLLKPYDKQATLLALMFGMFSFGGLYSMAELPPWLAAVLILARVLTSHFCAVFFHFFLVFPDGNNAPLLRRWPQIEYYLYLPALLFITPFTSYFSYLATFRPEQVPAFLATSSLIETLLQIIWLIYFLGGFCLLYTNYRKASPASKRKMRVVVTGSIAGFLPALMVVVVSIFYDLSRLDSMTLQWMLTIILLSFMLFPLSFAYAIVRHQVIPVSLIIRRGVRYLLVSRGFIIIEALSAFALMSFMLTGSRVAAIDRLGNRADIVVTMMVTSLSIVVLRLINRRVRPIIDRSFFREAYNAQQILTELGQAVREVKSIEQLLDLAVGKIQDALHTVNCTIFLRDEASGNFHYALSSTHLEAGQVVENVKRAEPLISRESLIVDKICVAAHLVDLDLNDGNDWTNLNETRGGKMLTAGERELLARMHSALLLPIMTKDQLLGIISLGPRLGDLPFSREDKQLLLSVAWQMAFAIENAKLIRQMAEEQRLKQELEMAKEVQSRLFPQLVPEFPSLDLAGVCHPARGVGGDYYDFIPLGSGQIGIAVADVAGKGISAALVMSIVQASLRSQLTSETARLTELVALMNRLLHRSTGPSSYATFFYAQFNEATRQLTYVNAGHNPPILVRAGAIVSVGPALVRASDQATLAVSLETGVVKALCTGGMVIGLFESCPYDQETIELSSGDILVAYTDGVTEAFNDEGEEYGEARLRNLVTANMHLSAEALKEKIVDSLREWCQQAAQHDDLTLVIMKVR